MRFMKPIVLAAALLTAFTTIASAHPHTPGVDRRQARQQVRIRHGARCDVLTRAEVRRLRMGQRHLRRMEWRAKRDGNVTRGERMRLQRGLDRQDRMIRRYKHNGRVRSA